MVRKIDFLVPLFGRFKSRKTKFILFSEGRTGGSTLLNLIAQHPNIAISEEPLKDFKTNPLPYINGYAFLASLNGQSFGCKIKSWHPERVQKKSIDHFIKKVKKDGWKLMYIRRRNYVKRAIALRARLDGKGYEYYKGKKVKKMC